MQRSTDLHDAIADFHGAIAIMPQTLLAFLLLIGFAAIALSIILRD